MDIKPQIAGDVLDIVNIAVTNDQCFVTDDFIAILDTADITTTEVSSFLIILAFNVLLCRNYLWILFCTTYSAIEYH